MKPIISKSNEGKEIYKFMVDNFYINRSLSGKGTRKFLVNIKKKIKKLKIKEIRSGTKVSFEGGEGVITSGTWSPTFKKNIGFCRTTKNFPETGVSTLRDKEINLHFCETNFLKYLK